MKNSSNYDKRPFITNSPDESQCAAGWDEVIQLLGRHPQARKVAIECYPGVLLEPLLSNLVPSLGAGLVINAAEGMLPASEIEKKFVADLGEDPVFGRMECHLPEEIFEIWSGSAIIYAQESAGDDPGRCIAVTARAGDQVIVPPGWAHCVINAERNKRTVFGAWCDRQYGFEYTGVRAHKGLAWFPDLTRRIRSYGKPIQTIIQARWNRHGRELTPNWA